MSPRACPSPTTPLTKVHIHGLGCPTLTRYNAQEDKVINRKIYISRLHFIEMSISVPVVFEGGFKVFNISPTPTSQLLQSVRISYSTIIGSQSYFSSM